MKANLHNMAGTTTQPMVDYDRFQQTLKFCKGVLYLRNLSQMPWR